MKTVLLILGTQCVVRRLIGSIIDLACPFACLVPGPNSEPANGPPYPLAGGRGSRMIRGLMLRVKKSSF